MLFMALGGAPLGFFYKAINTLDSMVGYKNDRYLLLGRFSARTDDAANLIPARVSALLMLGAAMVLGMDWQNGYRISGGTVLTMPAPTAPRRKRCAQGH